MKCKVLKTSFTPWGEIKEGEIIDAEGGKLKALLKLGYIEEVKKKSKSKKKADA